MDGTGLASGNCPNTICAPRCPQTSVPGRNQLLLPSLVHVGVGEARVVAEAEVVGRHAAERPFEHVALFVRKRVKKTTPTL